MDVKAALQQVRNQYQPRPSDKTSAKHDHENALKAVLHRMMEHAEARGRELEVDDENEGVINALTMYFNNDPEFEKIKPQFKLNKGIWLAGNFGSGKTMIMDTFRSMHPFFYRSKFGKVTCGEMNERFLKDEYKGLSIYAQRSYRQVSRGSSEWNAYHMLFDDLGEEEPTLKHYGNMVCVMAHILSERYKTYMNHGVITHITTNYTEEQIQKHYGGRINSRINEMFNVIVLGGSVNSKDRRK